MRGCRDKGTGQSFCCILEATATYAREHRCDMICAVKYLPTSVREAISNKNLCT